MTQIMKSNYKLTVDSAILANKVSVASHYLANYFKKNKSENVLFYHSQLIHTEYELKKPIKTSIKI